jgi:hypothetical protein
MLTFNHIMFNIVLQMLFLSLNAYYVHGISYILHLVACLTKQSHLHLIKTSVGQ